MNVSNPAEGREESWVYYTCDYYTCDLVGLRHVQAARDPAKESVEGFLVTEARTALLCGEGGDKKDVSLARGRLNFLGWGQCRQLRAKRRVWATPCLDVCAVAREMGLWRTYLSGMRQNNNRGFGFFGALTQKERESRGAHLRIINRS